MTALDLDVLSRVRLDDPPHRWGYLESALMPGAAAELRATFPTTGFWRLRHHDGEKGMSFRLRCVVPLGADRAIEPESLSPAWLALVDELMSDAYRDAFADALGQPLDDHALEVSAWRWGPAAHLGPHVDIPRKLASQVFYFNNDWDPAWGGCLHILGSDDPRDVKAELPPTLGSASIVVRSDSSWHAVPPVEAEAAEERVKPDSYVAALAYREPLLDDGCRRNCAVPRAGQRARCLVRTAYCGSCDRRARRGDPRRAQPRRRDA